jgi:hypothetical protein
MLDASQLAAAGLTPEEIAALQATRAPKTTAAQRKAIAGYPRYVFADSIWRRGVGELVRLKNAFDETGGSIVAKLSDAAYLVRVGDTELVVHEAEQAWA